jgi:PTH1 family peptidyl-tRNA hydrolase
MKLIVGLGNPGNKYTHTRHNAGFLAVDFFLKNLETINCKSSFSSQICEVHFHAREANGAPVKTFFIKPQTYMNNSGEAVQAVCNFYKVDPKTDLLVLHDEKDLLFGTFKFTTGSRSAGHNGVGDIIEKLGTQDFARIRIGVETRVSGDPTPTDAFVLQNFSEEELHTLNTKIFPETDKLIEQFINS